MPVYDVEGREISQIPIYGVGSFAAGDQSKYLGQADEQYANAQKLINLSGQLDPKTEQAYNAFVSAINSLQQGRTPAQEFERALYMTGASRRPANEASMVSAFNTREAADRSAKLDQAKSLMEAGFNYGKSLREQQAQSLSAINTAGTLSERGSNIVRAQDQSQLAGIGANLEGGRLKVSQDAERRAALDSASTRALHDASAMKARAEANEIIQKRQDLMGMLGILQGGTGGVEATATAASPAQAAPAPTVPVTSPTGKPVVSGATPPLSAPTQGQSIPQPSSSAAPPAQAQAQAQTQAAPAQPAAPPEKAEAKSAPKQNLVGAVLNYLNGRGNGTFVDPVLDHYIPDSWKGPNGKPISRILQGAYVKDRFDANGDIERYTSPEHMKAGINALQESINLASMHPGAAGEQGNRILENRRKNLEATQKHILELSDSEKAFRDNIRKKLDQSDIGKDKSNAYTTVGTFGMTSGSGTGPMQWRQNVAGAVNELANWMMSHPMGVDVGYAKAKVMFPGGLPATVDNNTIETLRYARDLAHYMGGARELGNLAANSANPQFAGAKLDLETMREIYPKLEKQYRELEVKGKEAFGGKQVFLFPELAKLAPEKIKAEIDRNDPAAIALANQDYSGEFSTRGALAALKKLPSAPVRGDVANMHEGPSSVDLSPVTPQSGRSIPQEIQAAKTERLAELAGVAAGLKAKAQAAGEGLAQAGQAVGEAVTRQPQPYQHSVTSNIAPGAVQPPNALANALIQAATPPAGVVPASERPAPPKVQYQGLTPESIKAQIEELQRQREAPSRFGPNNEFQSKFAARNPVEEKLGAKSPAYTSLAAALEQAQQQQQVAKLQSLAASAPREAEPVATPRPSLDQAMTPQMAQMIQALMALQLSSPDALRSLNQRRR